MKRTSLLQDPKSAYQLGPLPSYRRRYRLEILQSFQDKLQELAAQSHVPVQYWVRLFVKPTVLGKPGTWETARKETVPKSG